MNVFSRALPPSLSLSLFFPADRRPFLPLYLFVCVVDWTSLLCFSSGRLGPCRGEYREGKRTLHASTEKRLERNNWEVWEPGECETSVRCYGITPRLRLFHLAFGCQGGLHVLPLASGSRDVTVTSLWKEKVRSETETTVPFRELRPRRIPYATRYCIRNDVDADVTRTKAGGNIKHSVKIFSGKIFFHHRAPYRNFSFQFQWGKNMVGPL